MSGGGGWYKQQISVSNVFQKCFENDSEVFVSLSVLKLFVRFEVIAATRALGGLV